MNIGLINKSILNISGDNVISVINGITTQDISKIRLNQPMFTLFLNTRGQILFIAIIYLMQDNSLAIEINKEQLIDLAKHIHHFDLEKKLNLSEMDNNLIAISKEQHEGFYNDPRSSKLPFRAIINKEHNFTVNSKITEDYENSRLKLTIPEAEDIILQKTLANDINIEYLNGISFDKGCYLGQEITSKTKHIRNTKNKLVTLNNSILKIDKPLQELYLDNDLIGKTFSHNKLFVLAIIKRNITDLNKLSTHKGKEE